MELSGFWGIIDQISVFQQNSKSRNQKHKSEFLNIIVQFKTPLRYSLKHHAKPTSSFLDDNALERKYQVFIIKCRWIYTSVD